MSDIKVGDVNRERFESWYIQNWHDGDIHPHQSLLNHKPNEDDEYVSQAIQNMWEAWQAASSLIPEGFAIVPVAPTNEMICDGCDVEVGLEDSYYLSKATASWEDCKKVYAAMIKSQIKPSDK